MKSKILKTIAVVVSMVTCIGMTAFAAPSPSASHVVTGVMSAVDKSGRSISVRFGAVPAGYEQAVADLKTEASLQAYLGDFYNSNVTIADVREISFSDDAEFPVSVTFAMRGVTAGTKVQVLYYDEAAGKWVKLDTVAGDGTVTVIFDKAVSLIAFAVDKTTLASGTATSPQTSASSTSTIAVIGMAAVVVVCGLKKKVVVK